MPSVAAASWKRPWRGCAEDWKAGEAGVDEIKPEAGRKAGVAAPPPASVLRVVFDGKGGVTPVASGNKVPRVPARGFILVAGKPHAADFKAWLREEIGTFNADLLTARSMRSRCTVLEDKAFAILQFVRSDAKVDTIGRQFASFWIEKGRVIVASELDIPEFFGFAQWEQTHHAPASPADFMARLCLKATDRIEPLIEQLGDRLDDVEEKLFEQKREDSREALTRLRRSLIGFRKLLWPQRDVLDTLEIEDLSFFSMRDRAQLREAASRSARLGDELQMLSERAVLVHEQIIDSRAEEMNRAMLVLAAVTVVFMPLTVISGILGMNLAGIPYATSPYSFWVVAVSLVVLGAGTVWWMRRSKWL
jgi:zinc transporter